MLLLNKCIGTCAFLGGVPAVPTDFAWSWGAMVNFNAEALCQPGELVHYDRAAMSYHAYARNSLVERMRGDWLLMLDCDHAFDPDLCVRMVHRLETAQIDVLTALYCFKSPPHSPVLYYDDGHGPAPIAALDVPDGALVEVQSAGAGCLLVRRRVFDRIREELNEQPFGIIPPYSEDHSFFQRLKKLGIPAYCDPRIESHHLRTVPVSFADYVPPREDLLNKHDAQGVRC